MTKRRESVAEAADAIDFVLGALIGSYNDSGPIARLMARLDHLPLEQLDMVTRSAYDLQHALRPVGGVHETRSHVRFLLKHYGPDRMEKDRELSRSVGAECSECRASLPTWHEGVCRVCGEPADDKDSYYCSFGHRVQDAGDRPQ